jgi:hypothetical protein
MLKLATLCVHFVMFNGEWRDDKGHRHLVSAIASLRRDIKESLCKAEFLTRNMYEKLRHNCQYMSVYVLLILFVDF